MNAHNPPRGFTITEMTPDGYVTIPEHIQRSTGLVPGRAVVVGINDRGEAVILTRAQARRRVETADERRQRIEAALQEAGSGQYSTGQTTAEVMEDLRGHTPQ